mgnify:FL=1
MLKVISNFLIEDIWTLSDKELSTIQCLGVKTLKIILLSLQGFNRDLCQLRASALTLYTLLSIVPVIALLFGIAKGFGFEKRLESEILEQASDQDTMMLQLIEFSQNMLSTTKGGVVAGIGIVVLFWTVIKVIGNIEESFNHIWKIKKNRPLGRKLSDYLSLMMLAPVLLIVSSSMTVFIKTQITWLVEVIHLPAFGTKVVLYIMSFSPLVIMALLFTFVFLFMPNKKINIKAGVIAGITTGILYQAVAWAYISLQIGASSYNAIYGSFAALPLFLVWLQIVWMVVLFGCEISFYLHNFESYQHNEKFSDISISLKKTIALQVCHLIIKHFANSKKAPTAEQISHTLVLPVSVVQKTLAFLITANLIVELKVLDDEDVIYQPVQDISSMTKKFIVNALEKTGRNFIPDMTVHDEFINAKPEAEVVLLKDI